ncbi:UNVERIFIED_CONTAM: hypothetical protein Sradi_1561900 [Sesamum radiatum]|uniref:Integrase catalytic domain-containing protein n=1 Tax=Sesamum radiatum TaxID=300843 RepID=A0AAW2UA72_SESRA
MEVYVDDMLIKSTEDDHLKELRRAFDTMQTYGMKLNPDKCTFRVRGGKFLGYMVSERGIEANPEKIQAITGLRSPKMLNEMQKLTGKITSLSRFISKSTDRSLLFFKALRKAKEFSWTEECEQALDELKKYLATPPLLANPKLGEVLFLYLAVSEETVSSVLLREQGKNQNPVYYLALEAGVKEIDVCTDSQLVAMQISRTENERADALSKFGAMVVGTKERKVTLVIKEHPVIEEREDLQTIENSNSWKVEIMNYLKDGTLPDDPIKARRLKFKATRFTTVGTYLYKRTIDGPLLKCLDEERAQYVLREIHEGSCGNHSGGRSLAQKIIRQGYFWPTLVKDATEFAKKCESCQRFGIPRVLISDNGTQFQGKAITTWCKELKIQQNFTAVGNPQANGQTEVTNRTILQHLKTRLEGAKEIGEETQRVAQYESKRNQEGRAFDLTTIEEKRDLAYAKILHHKGLMMRSYNRRVRPRCFQVGDLVLKKVEVSKHVGKLNPGWEGPFKVIKINKSETYKLQDMEGKELPRPWNIHNLKKFYT